MSAAEWAESIIRYEIREVIGTQIRYVPMGYSEKFGYEWKWKTLGEFLSTRMTKSVLCFVVVVVLFCLRKGRNYQVGKQTDQVWGCCKGPGGLKM